MYYLGTWSPLAIQSYNSVTIQSDHSVISKASGVEVRMAIWGIILGVCRGYIGVI